MRANSEVHSEAKQSKAENDHDQVQDECGMNDGEKPNNSGPVGSEYNIMQTTRKVHDGEESNNSGPAGSEYNTPIIEPTFTVQNVVFCDDDQNIEREKRKVF